MYKHHRFPLEIIQYAEWLYDRFGLSHRYVEGLLAEQLTCQYRFKCFTQL